MVQIPFDAKSAEPNLDDLKQRLAESTQEFLDALALCDADDALGQDFIDQYLDNVADDASRSLIARESARDTKTLLRQFRSEKDRFTANVAIVNLAANNAIDGVLASLVENVLEALVVDGVPDLSDADNPATTAEALVHGAQRSAGEARAILGDADKNGMNRVSAMGEQVIRSQEMATTALLMRHATLGTFRRAKLEVTWEDLLERVRHQFEKEAGCEPDQTCGDNVFEHAAEVLGLAMEESGVLLKIPELWAKVKTVAGLRKIDLEPSGSEDLLQLHEQLRREVAILETMHRAYEQCLTSLNVPPAIQGAPLSS